MKRKMKKTLLSMALLLALSQISYSETLTSDPKPILQTQQPVIISSVAVPMNVVIPTTTVMSVTQPVSIKIDGSSNTIKSEQQGSWTVTVASFPPTYNGGNITVNVTSGTIYNDYNVGTATHNVITAYTSGSRSVGFNVYQYSALSEGGSNSFNVNSLWTLVLRDGVSYSSPELKKPFVSPTINYTVTTGTLTIILEGNN